MYGGKYMGRILFICLLMLMVRPAFSSGQDNTVLVATDTAAQKAGEQKQAESTKFDAGEMILEHVGDNHEWHIATIAGHHIVVPLPVIVFYNGQLYVFSSSRFHNSGHAWLGFTIPDEGADKEKIVRVEKEKYGKAGLPVYDFSITKTVFGILFSCALLLIVFLTVANAYKRNKNVAPHGIQNMVEPFILFIRDDVAKSSIGEKSEKYVPFLLTIFFFIFFNNLLGIIPIFPGGANVTGNLAVTGVMAVCTLVITTFSANRHYWIDIINTPGVPWWLKFPIPLMPIVEFIGVITKPFVLMVRLFANMLAGHIIILGFVSIIFIFGGMAAALGYGVSIVSILFMVFMDLLEVLVALIQAYVFTLLSALYFGLATAEPEHH
jgi:F-type H+-transporting ATPase subunit a